MSDLERYKTALYQIANGADDPMDIAHIALDHPDMEIPCEIPVISEQALHDMLMDGSYSMIEEGADSGIMVVSVDEAVEAVMPYIATKREITLKQKIDDLGNTLLEQQGDDKFRKLFFTLARTLKCLPSSFADDNGHVLLAAEKAMMREIPVIENKNHGSRYTIGEKAIADCFPHSDDETGIYHLDYGNLQALVHTTIEIYENTTKRESVSLQIGKYNLSEHPNGIWITGPDGDGGQFNIIPLEAAIAAFWNEHF